ncbi:MAG: dTMP kinase [Dehalococcoidia bacterium]
MGLFITFEGGEGSGKSTQARLLHKRLERNHVQAVLTREPGGTSLGDEIRRLLKKKRDSAVAPEAELFLFAASRAQLVADLIRPALDRNAVVICDRFTYSTVVYQGFGRGLDLPAVNTVNKMATGGIEPDLVILLDMPPEQGLGRKSSSDDRFESESLSFHRRIRDGYLEMAAAVPDRWLLVDASLTRSQIATIVWDRVSGLLRLPG